MRCAEPVGAWLKGGVLSLFVAMLLNSDARAQSSATPPKTPPANVKPGESGTVIKPPTQVDPGMAVRTPPADHFPMPVIKPGTASPQGATPH